jgi:hypothetical protein
MTPKRAPRARFPFWNIGQGNPQLLDPDWDDLQNAELEVRQPATRHTVARGSPGEGE